MLHLLVDQGDVVLTVNAVEASHGRVYVNVVPDRVHCTIDMTLCAIDGIADQIRREPDWWRGLVYLGQGQEAQLVALTLLVPRGR